MAFQLKVKVPLVLDEGPDRLGAEAGFKVTATLPEVVKALQPPVPHAATWKR